MKLVFAGTPEFSRAALASLQAAGHQIVLVLTQPDRPAGRGLKLQASSVKQAAQMLGLSVLQPRSLRLDGRFPDDAAAARAALQAAAPDVMVVAAYGLILPAWTLAVPRLGCLNIHASLLPRWRGAAPIHRAIEAGDDETGITIMQMDTGLDTGAMLLTAREPIRADDTTASLHDRLAALGARCINEALAMAASGALQPQVQPTHGVTYAHKVDKTEAAIDWAQPAALLARRLRAFDPFPGASFVHAGQTIKAWAGDAVDGNGAPGEVLSSGPDALVVACGEGALALTQLQRAGGRRQAARELLAAHPVQAGVRLSRPERP